jgi:glucose-1-phosphate thymidylyltransferase
MQAIIPLAGKGTRLRPHTHTRPKPLVRVANRPVLDHVLSRLQGAGVDEVICITGYMGEQMKDYLETEHADLRKRYVRQEEQLGTAHAIDMAREYVSGPVLIVFVDTIFEADLGVLDRRPDDDGIIWAKEVEDYQRFGVIVTDDDGYMERIVEKPDEPVSRLANIGVYFLRDHELLFEGIDHVLAGDPYLGEYFLTDAFQYMIDRGAKLSVAEVEGWWDCGKPETLLSTNRELLVRGEARAPDGGGAGVEEPVLVDPAATLDDVEIGPNVSIAAGAVVRRSRLRDCIVGEDSEVIDCRLERSLVGDHATVRGVSGTVNLGDHSEVSARD